MVALIEQRDVGDALAGLAEALEALEFGPDAPHWSAERDRLAGTIRNYLIPRTIDPSAPITVVLAGPTGSGKSTLMNSLSGMDVSRTGALRPTTRAPVVLTRPGATDGYETIGGVDCGVVEAETDVPDALVLVDAPDLDSTSTEHRAMAETLVDNADIVVFITSALRYADDAPWQVLRRAVSRGAPVIHVLNRVGSPSAGSIVDFRSRLSAAGFEDDLITVPEHHLSEDAQHVPDVAVQALRDRLRQAVANRDEFAGRAFDRVLRSTVSRTTELARSISSFVDECDGLASELAVHLADRVSALELEDAAGGLCEPPPGKKTPWSLRRWKKRVRQTDTREIERVTRRLVSRIAAIVQSDLRHWLTEERDVLQQLNVDPVAVTRDIEMAAGSTVEGWVRFVSRIAAEHDERDLWLAQAVLLDAAMTHDVVPATSIVLGPDGPVLVDRARRELWGRLEHLYAEAGDLVVDGYRLRHGYLDDEELTASLGAVTSALAPAYA